MSEEAGALGAELEAAVVRALRRDWELCNYNFFRDALRPPQLVLVDSEARLGRWLPDRRLIEISRQLVLTQPWGVVIEVLKHEMAHQYAHEVLQGYDESAHGEAFRGVCQRLSIDATASGLPRVPGPASEEEDRLPRRIAKLLALAESPNQHESEAAMREAQRLMLKYNVDASRSAARRRYGFRHLGVPCPRLQAHQHYLAAILGRFFFVEAIWVSVHRPRLGQAGTVLEVCGTDANLEMASYVHDFLLHSADRLWIEHKRRARIAGDRDRRSYLCGVMKGFFEKLEAGERDHRQQGLVWVKDGGLADFYQARHPRRRSVRSRARGSTDAFDSGKAAGQRLVLHKPVRGEAGERGRALPPRRDGA
jgi:hypothetical protein